MDKKAVTRKTALVALIAASCIGVGAVVRSVTASDHQDTPEVELNPRMDINDVYAFPGSATDRVVLVMTTSSPIAGTSATFDPNLLYQLKIDNSGDAKEDLVIQATFSDDGQTVFVRGPVAPTTQGMRSSLVGTSAAVSGAVGQTLSGPNGIQVFAGLRDDPFFIDLDQFFNILPDRRPSTGPLGAPSSSVALGPCANFPTCAFRNPGIDFLRGFNALAIVVELPKSSLVSSTAADAKFGVWGTISR